MCLCLCIVYHYEITDIGNILRLILENIKFGDLV